jgi:hypothetical protein
MPPHARAGEEPRAPPRSLSPVLGGPEVDMTRALNERRAQAFRRASRIMRAGVRLAAFGLMGLAIGWVMRERAGLTEAEQAASTLGSYLVWLFSACFVVGLFIVLPISSLAYRRAGLVGGQRDVRESAVAEEGSAEVREIATRELLPRWIGWPSWSFVAAISLWLIYVVLVHGIPSWFDRR